MLALPMSCSAVAQRPSVVLTATAFSTNMPTLLVPNRTRTSTVRALRVLLTTGDFVPFARKECSLEKESTSNFQFGINRQRELRIFAPRLLSLRNECHESL